MNTLDLTKADRFLDEAAELYDNLALGKNCASQYEKLTREYADVDVLNLLREIYALRRYKFDSRGWRRQSGKLFKKSRRYRRLCEGQVKRNGV